MPHFLIWSAVGALAGALVARYRRPYLHSLLENMIDGAIGACVGGEMLHRWDASQAAGAAGFASALLGGALFAFLMNRLRPV